MAYENPQLPPRFRDSPIFHRDTEDTEFAPRARKGASLFLLLLLVLAAAVALFGAGSLPQLNSIFDSLTNSLHSHNDAAVGSIMSSGEIILIAGVVILVAIILLLWRNTARRKLPR